MKIPILILFLVSCMGCASGRRDEYGRLVPKRPAYRLSDSSLERSSLIAYDAVYIGEAFDSANGRYVMLKFWPDGHFMRKRSNSAEPNVIDSKVHSAIGYFRTEGRTVTTENFAAINFGQYGYGMYEILEDGSLERTAFGHRIRCSYKIPAPNRTTFVPTKHEVPFLPDW
jgi:hypothetical protein